MHIQVSTRMREDVTAVSGHEVGGDVSTCRYNLVHGWGTMLRLC